MDQCGVYVYKLIQAVDPTTKNVPIRERFAKLTLSSNKKQKETRANESVDMDQNPVRRSLQFERRANEVVQCYPQNPLLRSDSDSVCEESAIMEPLVLSQTVNEIENGNDQMDALSQKISCLTMNTNDNEANFERISENSTPLTAIDVSSSLDNDESAITISSEGSKLTTVDCPLEYNMVTSSVPLSGETADAVLPCTLSNDKADRIETFLRDVSQQRRDWQLSKTILANAETESMNGLCFEAETERKSYGIASDDTVAMTEAHLSFFEKDLLHQNMVKESNSLKASNDSRCLAFDDTEINTQYTHPDTSVATIPETASECTSEDNEALSASDELEPNDNIENAGMISIQKSELQINISAQINIKIQISHLISDSSESESGGYKNSIYDNDIQKNSMVTSSENIVQQENCEKRKENIIQNENENDERRAVFEDVEVKSDFMEHAEKLLNQLYGQSWQTPEVIHKLKRSNNDKEPMPYATNRNQLNCTNEPRQRQNIDDSYLDDFSIFQRNIANTNLDSTRLTNLEANQFSKAVPKTVPRPCQRLKTSVANTVLQTELKKRTQTVRVTSKARTERRHQMVNKSTASDDSDVVKTESDNNCDSSWSGKSYVDSDTSNESLEEEEMHPISKKNSKQPHTRNKPFHLNLSMHEVSVSESTRKSPEANKDSNFKANCISDILRTCRIDTKAVIHRKSTNKTKRKLFTLNFGDEEDKTPSEHIETPKLNKHTYTYDEEILIDDAENINRNKNETDFKFLDKRVKALRDDGKLIFPLTPPKTTTPIRGNRKAQKEPISTSSISKVAHLPTPPHNKYGFLKSLDVYVSKSLCHPDALVYREKYRSSKEELTKLLYDLYNTKLFNGSLLVPVVWNKKLLNTAGRCLNKTKLRTRSCVVELSEKVLTSADRLRCTLIHELCHAATWIFNGENGHGSAWKKWAQKANTVFPELPKIGRCHQYDIEYKYTYKCTLCNAESYAHSKSRKAENLHCSYCHGNIEVFLNKKDKEGNVMQTPVREPTGFAKFVKDNYKQFKQPELKHGDVMKLLSNEFAALKVSDKINLD